MPRIAHIYQIFYSNETEKMLDPGFVSLDNRSNQRPDWREYWPIRWFLQNMPIEPNGYYGFFSPRFRTKTGLTSTDVRRLIDSPSQDFDLIHFSPFSDAMTFHWSVFAQGEAAHPGMLSTADMFFTSIGLSPLPSDIVNHSFDCVFCNYFVAKPAFWAAWFPITEALFQAAEGGEGELARRLNQPVDYLGQNVSMKVFILERVASYLLAAQPTWTSLNACPFSMPTRDARYDSANMYLAALDAMKYAYATTKHDSYRAGFEEFRTQILRQSVFNISSTPGESMVHS